MTQHECTVYKCGYCRKRYLVKHACEKHEKYCPKNPHNMHACFTCQHLDRDEGVVEGPYGSIKTKAFWCHVLEKELHSYVAERIGHDCLGHTERMPLECSYHSDNMDKVNQVTARINGATEQQAKSINDDIHFFF